MSGKVGHVDWSLLEQGGMKNWHSDMMARFRIEMVRRNGSKWFHGNESPFHVSTTMSFSCSTLHSCWRIQSEGSEASTN